jgi:hypothetical protein
MVSRPGHRPYKLEHEERVPRAKSPVQGDALPVTVSLTDPSRLRIDWDAAPDLADRARAAVGEGDLEPEVARGTDPYIRS